MYKIALERAGTSHIAKTLEIRKTTPCYYALEKDLLGYKVSYPYADWQMKEVRFEVTDREWQGHRVFREVI
jgi:hypothetical protein